MWQKVKGWFKSDGPAIKEPHPVMHPSWWHRAPSNATVLVFVHGLLSDGNKCWTSSSGVYWPDLVKSDPETCSYSLFIAQYYTAIDSGEYDLVQCANALYDSLKEKRADGNRVLDFPQIVFVCHSLGGIVTRRMLEENSFAFRDARVGLVLLASPSLGSDYAYWTRHLSSTFGNKTVAGLIPGDAVLNDLDQRFKRMLDEKRIPQLIGAEACEHKSPGSGQLLSAFTAKVVSTSSASRYFGQAKIMEKTDHSSIAKPPNVQHPSYRFLKTFLLDKFAPPKQEEKINVAHVANGDNRDVPKSALVLFDVYSSACGPYYCARPVDTDLSKQLEIGNAWLTGASGAGKTAVVKHHIDSKNIRHIELSLGHYSCHMTPANLWAEIGAAFTPPKQTTNLSELARELSQQQLSIVIDEVPIEANSTLEIVGAIASLSEAVRRYSAGRSQVIVCSIECPDFGKLGTKVLEHLHVVKVPAWDAPQLLVLSEIIELALPELKLTPPTLSALIAAADGTPRFVKAFYRRRLRACSDEAPLTSLALTSESFVHHGK